MTLPDGLYHFLRGLVLLGGGAAIVFILVLALIGRWERKRVEKVERSDWLLVEYDDGVRIYLSSYAGGAAKEGAWGKLSLMRTAADGSVTFRDFIADGPWEPSEITHAWVDEAQHLDDASVRRFAGRRRDQNVRMPR